MSYYRDHDYTHGLRPGAARQSYAAVVGTVETGTEQPITGRSGDHLQFDVRINGSSAYQVDINTQSSDGSAIQAYIYNDPSVVATGSDPSQPFGPPSYGVMNNAQLSYAGLGLQDSEFQSVAVGTIEQQLETALRASVFVAVYGISFSDPPGIHDIHYNPGRTNQDGAIAIYSLDSSNKPARTWFFFKFANESIAS